MTLNEYQRLKPQQQAEALQHFFHEAFSSDMGNIALGVILEDLKFFDDLAVQPADLVLKNFAMNFLKKWIGATNHAEWAKKALEIGTK